MNLIEGDYFGLEFQNHQKMMVSEEEKWKWNLIYLSLLYYLDKLHIETFLFSLGLGRPYQAHYQAAQT